MKKYDITGLGELLIDFCPMGVDGDGDSVFVRKAGGAPLNLLATAAAHGAKTAYIGKVGNDMFGRFLIRTVESCGIDARGLKVDDIHNTTMAFVALDASGDRDFAFCRRFGADTFLTPDEVDTDLIASSRIFHFGSLSSTTESGKQSTQLALDTAKAAGCLVSYDPNYRPSLWDSADDAAGVMRHDVRYADIVKVSREELAMVTGTEVGCPCEAADAAIAALAEAGVRVIVVTDGPRPVRVSVNGTFATVVPAAVNAIDTTGAGDIFFGSFLSAFLRSVKDINGLTLGDVAGFAAYANGISGVSTQKHGAISSIPEIRPEDRLADMAAE